MAILCHFSAEILVPYIYLFIQHLFSALYTTKYALICPESYRHYIGLCSSV